MKNSSDISLWEVEPAPASHPSAMQTFRVVRCLQRMLLTRSGTDDVLGVGRGGVGLTVYSDEIRSISIDRRNRVWLNFTLPAFERNECDSGAYEPVREAAHPLNVEFAMRQMVRLDEQCTEQGKTAAAAFAILGDKQYDVVELTDAKLIELCGRTTSQVDTLQDKALRRYRREPVLALLFPAGTVKEIAQ